MEPFEDPMNTFNGMGVSTLYWASTRGWLGTTKVSRKSRGSL